VETAEGPAFNLPIHQKLNIPLLVLTFICIWQKHLPHTKAVVTQLYHLIIRLSHHYLSPLSTDTRFLSVSALSPDQKSTLSYQLMQVSIQANYAGSRRS
jgi:hypothetical protein